MRLYCKYNSINYNDFLAKKGCLDFNGNACLQCDIEDKGPDTNFKYKCKSVCNYN